MTPVYDLTPFTMLDFPDKTACVVWFAGCNMRCGYCHNPGIVRGEGTRSCEEILSFLEKRRGLLDGVVISGGEATVYKGLPDFIRQIRQKGYAVKLDSNGTNPAMIRDLFDNGLIDYLALDYKASPCKFSGVTKTGPRMWRLFQETLDYLCTHQQGKFEVRTTVHSGMMGEKEINLIVSDLADKNYQGVYYIQNYTHHENGMLEDIQDQEQPLDLSSIERPESFRVEMRNF